MKLREIIQSDMKSAMRERKTEELGLLRVILGEINTLSKAKDRKTEEVSDDEVIVILKKMKDNAVEMGDEGEVKILDTYLPEMLEEKQLEVLIKGIINTNGFEGMKDMGKVMGELKSKYGSTYDGKIASQIVRNNL